MVKIYTKTGDKGETSLFGGKRVQKNNRQIHAYGAVDELSSILGVVHNTHIKREDKELTTDIQKNLYLLMSFLSGAPTDGVVLSEHIQSIEKYIDTVEENLPPIHRFILPQGTPEAVWLHVARSVCRRAEREVVAWVSDQTHVPDSIVMYLNRLSDLLFVLSRKYNKNEEVST